MLKSMLLGMFPGIMGTTGAVGVIAQLVMLSSGSFIGVRFFIRRFAPVVIVVPTRYYGCFIVALKGVGAASVHTKLEARLPL